MTKFVVWSGGFDSTLVLQRLCEMGTAQDRVCVISIILANHNTDNTPCEQKARKQLQKLFQKDGWFNFYEIIYDPARLSIMSNLPLQTLWFLLTLPFLKKNDNIYFGYIRGDDFWHYKQDFLDLIEAYKKLNNLDFNVIFPLEWMEKCAVIRELKPKYRRYCWTCDSPTEEGRPCGKCHPCVVLYNAQHGKKMIA
jgi:7-cyano-7-deazaguanine synthase in queuosine biosynthesis